MEFVIPAGDACWIGIGDVAGHGLPSSPVDDTEHGDSTSLIDL